MRKLSAILTDFLGILWDFLTVSYCNYRWNLDPYIWSRGQRTIQGIETQRFLTSKEVQDTELIKQGVGLCLLGQRWNFACRLPGKRCNQHGRVLHSSSRQTEAATGLWTLRQAFERNLVSSRQYCPHKVAIRHQKLADLHFEVLKHPSY
jgi:hypothetical protein